MLKRSKHIASLLAAMSIGIMAMQGEVEAATDIRGHWAEERIGVLIGEGIISGYPDGTFKPNKNITREEASKIISEYVGERKTGTVELKDVSGIWSEPYIKHLYLEGIVNGYVDRTFRPKNSIIRSEFVTMIYNYLKKNGELEKSYTSAGFKDTRDHWAKESIDAVSKLGYIRGYPDKTFKPDEPISRAEVSSIVALMIEDGEFEIKTSWSEDHESNMDAFIDELGFEKDGSGNWDRVPGLSNPIGIYRDRPDIYEVSIVVRDWKYEDIAGSEKIPLVFDEILKFYFRDEAEYAYSKMDDESITEFETSDRFIRLRDNDGKLYIYLGYKGGDKFDKWW